VRLVTALDTKHRREVASELRDFLDVGKQGLIDRLLGGNASSIDLLSRFLFGFRDDLVSLLGGGGGGGLGGSLGGAEEVVVDGGWNVDAGEWDGCGGGDDVGGVDTAEGDAVDLVWAGDEQQARWEVLQDDCTLSLVAACEQDDDDAWLERGADLGWTKSAGGWEGTWGDLSGVEFGGSLLDDAGLLLVEGLGLGCWLGDGLLGLQTRLGGLGEFVESTRETSPGALSNATNAGSDEGVRWLCLGCGFLCISRHCMN